MDRPSIGAGEVVPSVNASEVRSVWELFEKNRSRFPVQQFAVGLGAIQRVCSPDADVSAVVYRFAMLQVFDLLRVDALALWRGEGMYRDAIFKVAATIPLKGSGMRVPQPRSLNFDDFLLEVSKYDMDSSVDI